MKPAAHVLMIGILAIFLVSCSHSGVNVGVSAGVNIPLYTEATNGSPHDRN